MKTKKRIVVVRKGHPLRSRRTYKQRKYGRRYILLIPKATVLLRQDPGSDGLEPASSFVFFKFTV